MYLGKDNAYFPSVSVTADADVPSNETMAPISGSELFLSIIVPVNLICAYANTLHAAANSMDMKILFILLLVREGLNVTECNYKGLWGWHYYATNAGGARNPLVQSILT